MLFVKRWFALRLASSWLRHRPGAFLWAARLRACALSSPRSARVVERDSTVASPIAMEAEDVLCRIFLLRRLLPLTLSLAGAQPAHAANALVVAHPAGIAGGLPAHPADRGIKV